jgi:hypothetical protein
MKKLVVASTCGGKSTLTVYIREHWPLQPVYDLDEVVLAVNGGEWPRWRIYKDVVLVPIALRKTRGVKDGVVFACPMRNLGTSAFKSAGFEVILIDVSEEVLHERNKERMVATGRGSAATSLPSQVRSIRALTQNCIPDRVLDGDRTVAEIAGDIMA